MRQLSLRVLSGGRPSDRGSTLERTVRHVWLLARRHYLIALGSFLVLVEAVRKGVDTYYDFLNIKWVMGWMMSNGDFNLKGIASTRKWAPPYLDMWNSVWASVGPWWLPNVIHGVAHLMVVPSVFVLARRVAPQLPNLIHQLVAVVSVSVPLVRMQIGTSTGHLYAALSNYLEEN